MAERILRIFPQRIIAKTVSYNAKMTNPVDIYFEIKDGVNFLRIDVLKQNFPNSELDWDKNSLNCLVSVKCGRFSGDFNTDLMSTDFKTFKAELETLYENLDKTATFEGIENQVTIQVEGDGIGHLTAKCSLMDNAGIGNKLICEMNFDQTELPKLNQQLNKIISIYKVF
ncbi:WapI family immunity protein [Gaetbulibacter sp. PBL-D1]|uniref:WapI family immunity protein n=1 Tax=Gaetbulibacter sp. PBL-D1 TaxID=3422594 RepID=UPI003D2EB264